MKRRDFVLRQLKWQADLNEVWTPEETRAILFGRPGADGRYRMPVGLLRTQARKQRAARKKGGEHEENETRS
jgi:hypothetical protein